MFYFFCLQGLKKENKKLIFSCPVEILGIFVLESLPRKWDANRAFCCSNKCE
jgi:hypothetical protein